jgi:hypothetical protein
MTPHELHRLLLAPELIVLDFVNAALLALERALYVEHPLVGAPPPTEHPPIRRRAAHVLRCAQQLRRELRRYRSVANRILREQRLPDLPF